MTTQIFDRNFAPARAGRWLALPLALLAFLAWGGSVSAAELAEHPKPEPGILITGVGADGPAAEAGVVRGDILLAVDGDAINTPAELRHVILQREPGDSVELTVRHGDEEKTLTVTLGDRNGRPVLGVATDTPRAMRQQPHRSFGRMPGQGGGFFFHPEEMPGMGGPGQMPFEMRPFEMRPFFGMGAGPLIVAVAEDGPAAAAGLQAGDVISAVGDVAVSNFDELVAALAEYSPDDEVDLTVQREGEAVTVAVTLGAHPDDPEKAFLGVQIAAVQMDRFRTGPHGEESGPGSREKEENDESRGDGQGRRPEGNRLGLHMGPGDRSAGPMQFFFRMPHRFAGPDGGHRLPFELDVRPFRGFDGSEDGPDGTPAPGMGTQDI